MKIAFVTPWYGEIPGGMESETRQTAERLAARGWPVEIFTTCIRDFFADWSHNHHRPGATELNGVTVRRFAVQKRDRVAFDAVNARLMSNLPITPQQERVYIEEMFRCPDLFRYLSDHQQEYIFFFIPYMFATTYYGVQIAPRRSVIIPCLHDESYARLGLYKQTIPQARALALHTETELALVERLYGRSLIQWRELVGEGVDTTFTFDANRFRANYNLPETPFLLYVGRRDAGKNVPLLINYWTRYITQEANHNYKLLLMGPGEIQIPPEMGEHIIDLGFAPLQDKYDAYAAATAICQPSLNESFSLVMMESWLAGTPTLVHGRCAVTADHCRRSNGGLYFTNYDEFAGTVTYLFTHPETARKMGANGRAYVHNHFTWDVVLDKYEKLIRRLELSLEN